MWTSRRRRKRVVVLFVLLVVVEVFVIRSFTVAGAQEFCRSACGNITNIAFPFRLKGDPPNCGDQRYELACENNRTVLNLLHWLDSPKKFYVQAITHQNYTIRLVDPGLVQDHCSPFPIHSMSRYTLYHLMSPFVYIDYYDYYDIYKTITFINCPVPANSSQFVSASFCGNNSNASSFSPPPLKSYVALGYTRASDVENSCRIGPVVLSSFMSAFEFDSTSSFSEYREASSSHGIGSTVESVKPEAGFAMLDMVKVNYYQMMILLELSVMTIATCLTEITYDSCSKNNIRPPHTAMGV